MPAADREQDLGALFAQVTRRLIAAERPLLQARGISMWAYVALTRLAEGPASTQQALAQQMGYDKTRLIALLDELAAAGLIERRPDPDDRRARIVALTDAGRARYRAPATTSARWSGRCWRISTGATAECCAPR